MNKNMDYNNFSGSGGYNNSQNFSPYENSFDSTMYEAPMINPIMQYEQAYMYYKYLTQQMDYRIKCKEYEKLGNK